MKKLGFLAIALVLSTVFATANVIDGKDDRDSLVVIGPSLGLSDGEIDALVKHFGAMLKTGWLYERKCIVCHERAVDLARLHLIEREGRLEGRYTGRDIASFLTDHGRLAPAEIATVLAMLRRQLRTEEH